MSAQDVAQLQRTLGQAISLLGQTLPHVTDFDSDEALAWQVYGEQMTACVTSTAENPSPAQLVTEKQETTQHAERECSSCIEATRDQDLIVLKCCQTIFCKTCFRTWIETSLHGNTLPSCCGARISMGVYGKSLTVAMRRVYTRVEEELSADHKIHCGNERCGKIILLKDETSPFVKCRYCRNKTCTTCKERISAHGRFKTCRSYLNDTVLEQILDDNKWKRCPACFAPVEKTSGCDNVKCTCGSLFCFRCGDRKKSEGHRCRCFAAVMDLGEREPYGDRTAVNVNDAVPAGVGYLAINTRGVIRRPRINPQNLSTPTVLSRPLNGVSPVAGPVEQSSRVVHGEAGPAIDTLRNDDGADAMEAITSQVEQEPAGTQEFSSGTIWSAVWTHMTSWL